MNKEPDQLDCNNLTRKQEKAIKFLTMLWEYGITQSNFTGDHSEYSSIVLMLAKMIR